MCCHWICQCLSNFTSDLFWLNRFHFFFVQKIKDFFSQFTNKRMCFLSFQLDCLSTCCLFIFLFFSRMHLQAILHVSIFLSFKHAQMLAVHHFWGKKSFLKIVWICHTPADSFKETMTSLFLVSKHSTALIHSIKMSNLVKFSFLNICSLRSDNDFSPIFSKGVGNEFLNIS